MQTGKTWKNLVSAFLIMSFMAPTIWLVPWHEVQAQGSSLWVYSIYGADGVTREGQPYTSLASCQADLNTPAFPGEQKIGPCIEIEDVGASTVTGTNTGSQPTDPRLEAATGASKSCANLIGGSVKNLFGKGKDVATNTVVSQAGENAITIESVPVSDVNIQKKLDALNTKTDSIKTGTDALNKKQNCWDGIAKVLMKIAIRRITLSIIDWINSGYDGKPFFLENPEGFFKDIAKNEILSFGASINNTFLFPFGRNFMLGAITAFRNKFEANAQYSLNELIAKTYPGKAGVDFNANFNIGGWEAWLGMTYPQNNPVGFNIMAANQLSVNLAGTNQSKANEIKDQLIQTGGFLGDERCVDPQGVTHEEDRKARTYNAGSSSTYRKCNRWEYVTPGKLIAERAVYASNSPLKSLEMADEINSALAAISDAALNQFVTNLSNKGLKSITGVGNTETYNISSNFNPSSNLGTQFPDFFVAPGSWISNHLNFDMRKDVTQAFVDEQRIYQNKLASYSDALNALVKNVRQLDYCIPGPNPDWETNAYDTINGLGEFSRMPGWWETDTSQLLFSLLDPSGIFTMIGNSETDKKTRAAAARAASRVLKVNITSNQDQLSSHSGVITLFNNVFDSYRGKMKEIYFSGPIFPKSGVDKKFLPSVTSEARAEYERVPGYLKIAENNIKEIAFRKSIVTRLEGLKNKIDALNAQLAAGTISGAQYEINFESNAPLVTEFARLSAYFVDGDAIADIDNKYKEALDRSQYVYDDLLTGPFGCEKELENLYATDKLTYSTYVRRQPYPHEIHYFYAGPNDGGPWHDAWTPAKLNAYNTNVNQHNFLFGSVYWNKHGGSSNLYGVGGSYSPCPEYQKIGNDSGSSPVTLLSIPSDDASGGDIPFATGCVDGTSNCSGINYYQKDSCGNLAGFEKSFGVY